MPKISAVVPVYNVEKYLAQCLDSALAQTLTDIEIICVDDGSTDGSPAMLDAYAEKDSRVKVIHKENGGYGKAMNTGLEHATGEYFAVLESDDYLMPDSYELLYRNAVKFDADIVRGDYYDYSTYNGQPNLKLKQITQDSTWYYRLICPNDELEVYSFVMHNWTGIYRLSYLRENGIRYNETPGASYQDNGFWFQVFSQTERLVYVPHAAYCYRIDNPASSIHDPQKVYTARDEYAFIRSFLAQHPEFEETLEPVYYARLFRIYHQTVLRIDEQFRKEFVKFFRDTFIEACDTHKVQTGLMTENERDLLLFLLASEKYYLNRAVPSANESVFSYYRKQAKMIRELGGNTAVRRNIRDSLKEKKKWRLI